MMTSLLSPTDLEWIWGSRTNIASARLQNQTKKVVFVYWFLKYNSVIKSARKSNSRVG
jgi:hypothetical protein